LNNAGILLGTTYQELYQIGSLEITKICMLNTFSNHLRVFSLPTFSYATYVSKHREIKKILA